MGGGEVKRIEIQINSNVTGLTIEFGKENKSNWCQQCKIWITEGTVICS